MVCAASGNCGVLSRVYSFMCGDLLYTMELFRLNLQHLRQVSKDYQFLVGLFSSPRSTRDFEDET